MNPFQPYRAIWRLFILWMAVALPMSLTAQLGGVENIYQVVQRADFCNNLVVMESASGFSVGDRALLIQMQGAQIDSSDAVTYGDIPSFGQTGKYEILTIADIASNIITFQEAMVNMYDGPGLQLIRVPSFANASVTSTLTGQPWDGETGGVVAIEVTGTLTLNADIDATGIGFRGGATLNNPACSGPTGYDGYRCATALGCGGFKGEGIARITAEPLGRGRPANGGGGGNDQLAGGGGGSNFAIGGTGGSRLNLPAGACPGTNPGFGGRTLPYSNAANRVFMGGGGGAGDEANGTATAGGNGGGIIIISANEIVGNGFSIRANGATPALPSGADGAGGGGGGGSILLDVNTYTGVLSVFAEGGNGGDVDNSNDPTVCAGPGGGGSGGAVWPVGAVLPVNVSVNLNGGQPGNTLNANAPSICGNNGAQPGSRGDTLNSLVLVSPTQIFEPVTASLTPDTVLCPNANSLIGVLMATGTGVLTYTWNTGDTTALILAAPGTTPTVYTVSILDERGCGITRTITATSGIGVSAEADPKGLIASGQNVLLTATQDPYFSSYTWSPDSFLTTTTGALTVASPTRNITYCVEATDTLGCVTSDCVTIAVDIFVAIPNAFTPNGDGLNDVFRLPQKLPCNTVTGFRIFNRWGELIFEAADGFTGWDGTWRGKPVETGSYIYWVDSECEDGRTKSYRGTVTVIY